MKVRVSFAGNLTMVTNNTKKLEYELERGSSLNDLFTMMERQFAGIRSDICNDLGEVADHINVYINGDNVRYLDKLNTELRDGDAVHFIPAAAAG